MIRASKLMTALLPTLALFTPVLAVAEPVWTPEIGNYNPDTKTVEIKLGSITEISSCVRYASDPDEYVVQIRSTWSNNPITYLGGDQLRLTNRDLQHTSQEGNQIGGWDPEHMPKAKSMGYNYSLLRTGDKVQLVLNISGFAGDNTVACHDTVIGFSQAVVKL